MRIEDKPEFTKLLAAAMDVYGRQITTGFVDIFFAALGQYDLATVREALNRHLQDPEAGRFQPKPADLIRQIVNASSGDGRPGREEAWAIAQTAKDETKTVMLTEEIIGALEIARPLLESRDKVAARLAFVESYDRLVSERRSSNADVSWHVSYGTDASLRAPAIEAALVKGLLPAPQAAALLAQHTEQAINADGLAIAGLLAGGKVSSPDELRARWRDLRNKIRPSVKENAEKTRLAIQEAERELLDHKQGETDD